MNRRGFLQGCVALAVAPAIVRFDSLMSMVPTETVIWKCSERMAVWVGDAAFFMGDVVRHKATGICGLVHMSAADRLVVGAALVNGQAIWGSWEKITDTPDQFRLVAGHDFRHNPWHTSRDGIEWQPAPEKAEGDPILYIP